MLFRFPIDADRIGEAFYYNSLMLITIIELLILYFNKDEFQNIMKKLPRKYSSEEIANLTIKPLIRKTKIVYSVPSIFLIFSTAVQIGQNFFVKERKFKIDFKFPFDITHPIVFYGMTANLVIFLCFFASIYIAVCPILKFGLISVVAIEFEKLRDQRACNQGEKNILYVPSLFVLNPTTSQKKHGKTIERTKAIEDIKAQLIILVNRQNELFEIRNQLEKFFSFSLFFHHVTGGIVICALLFSTFPLHDVVDSIFKISNLLIIANFLRLQCEYGQRLKDASLNVSDGIYGNGWENLEDEKLKQMLVLIMARSQKSTALTALKFNEVNLEQFSKIVTSAYSYYTFVKHLYKDNL